MRTPTAKHPQIFKALLEEPSSLYRIYTKFDKKIRSGTIYKILKSLQKRGYIRIYQPHNPEEKRKLEKDLWGPTILGIFEMCVVDENTRKKLESYYEKWLSYPEFLEELKLHGFDLNLVKNKPSKAKEVFQKFIELCIMRRKKGVHFLKNPLSYDIKTRDSIGEFLLGGDPEYKKIFRELYTHMPGIQDSVNSMFENLGLEYKKLKKQLK